MPRYFFHVSDGKSAIKDAEGQTFAALEDARRHATRIAAELSGRPLPGLRRQRDG
jgi:hypothetical protein